MGLASLSAVEMLAGFRAGRFSPSEVVADTMAAIDAWEPGLGAIFCQHRDRAVAQAAASTARWQKGAPLGALDGVPVTIKDLIATEGDPTPVGTAALPLSPAPADAPPAARLREAGAIVVGKTTMPDFGMLSSGLSSFHPLGRNPWRADCTAGGSSGGAAAAAAAGLGPLHVGTDIGGSVRLPANWCGIFALKPSNGRIPIDPPFPGRVAGPMTRSVADSALLMEVLSGADARDHMALPPAVIDWQDLQLDVRGLRLGLLEEAGCGLPVDPEILASVREAARLFEQAGAHVELVRPVLTQELLDGIDLFWRTRFRAQVETMAPDQIERILPFIRAWVAGAEGADGLAVYRGFECMLRLRKAGHDALRGFDFWLSPVSPVAAFAAELPCPTHDVANPFAHIGFTLPYNMTEQPACSVPCGMTADGLPIGLQIIGQRFDDLGVLRMAAAFEAMRAPLPDWPRARRPGG